MYTAVAGSKTKPMKVSAQIILGANDLYLVVFSELKAFCFPKT